MHTFNMSMLYKRNLLPSIAELQAAVDGRLDDYFALQDMRRGGIDPDRCPVSRGTTFQNDLERIRWHESGHAVAALAIWHKHPRNFLSRVTAQATGGRVDGNDPPTASDMERIIVSVSGPEADAIYQAWRMSVRPQQSVSNGEHADREIAERLVGRSIDFHEWESARAHARQILRGNWQAVAGGVELLKERESVTGSEFEEYVKPLMWAS